MSLVLGKEGGTLMVFKKGIPFFSPLQNSLLLECYFLLILSSGCDRNSLGQQENPGDQYNKNDFPFPHPESPKSPLS
jgi:hypothetical protein